MEMAKVTSKGQITIPVSVRRKLGINEGDKLLFIDRPDGVLIVHPNMLQGEAIDRIISEPTATGDGSSSAGTRSLNNSYENKAYEPPTKSESQNKPSGGFDVAALLNEIRSMGSKI